MNNNCLFSLQGSFLIGVDAEKASELTLKNLVRAKKAQSGLIEAPRYDMNDNGVVDEADIAIIRRKLVGLE